MPRALFFRGLILVFVLGFATPSAFAAVFTAGAGTLSSADSDAHGTMDPNG